MPSSARVPISLKRSHNPRTNISDVMNEHSYSHFAVESIEIYVVVVYVHKYALSLVRVEAPTYSS